MPKSCWEEQQGVMLPEIAMWLRQAYSGAADPYPEQESHLALLKKAVKDWEPSLVSWAKRVDDAVLELVKAVIAEAERAKTYHKRLEARRAEASNGS